MGVKGGRVLRLTAGECRLLMRYLTHGVGDLSEAGRGRMRGLCGRLEAWGRRKEKVMG